MMKGFKQLANEIKTDAAQLPWPVWIWGITTLIGLGGVLATVQGNRQEMRIMSNLLQSHVVSAGHAVVLERVSHLQGEVRLLEERIRDLEKNGK